MAARLPWMRCGNNLRRSKLKPWQSVEEPRPVLGSRSVGTITVREILRPGGGMPQNDGEAVGCGRSSR